MDTKFSKEARGRRLRNLRQLADMTAAEFGEALGVSRQTIHAWEKGTLIGVGIDQIKAEQIISAAKKYGVQSSIAWLLHGIGNSPILHEAKDEGALVANNIFESIYYTDVDQEAFYFQTLYKNSATLKITDDTMLPYFQPDDYVGGLWFSGDLKKIMDISCIIKLDSGISLLRKFTASQKNGLFNLYHINEQSIEARFINNVKIKSAAVVSRMWRRKTTPLPLN